MCNYGSMKPYTIKDLGLYHTELKRSLTKKNNVTCQLKELELATASLKMILLGLQ